jgi:hypothetical protein
MPPAKIAPDVVDSDIEHANAKNDSGKTKKNCKASNFECYCIEYRAA